MPYFIIVNENGARLCQDNRWRNFANFGTYRECVKTYKMRHAAEKRAMRVHGFVQTIGELETMDAAGNILVVADDGNLTPITSTEAIAKLRKATAAINGK